jgi:metal-responsive CopG/Arc/MetJ family transcriptional regulator
MKTAISLPDPLFEAVSGLASRLGISRSELFQRAVERLLCEYDDRGVTEALNRVYAETSAAVDPALASMQARSLPNEDW